MNGELGGDDWKLGGNPCWVLRMKVCTRALLDASWSLHPDCESLQAVDEGKGLLVSFLVGFSSDCTGGPTPTALPVIASLETMGLK